MGEGASCVIIIIITLWILSHAFRGALSFPRIHPSRYRKSQEKLRHGGGKAARSQIEHPAYFGISIHNIILPLKVLPARISLSCMVGP